MATENLQTLEVLSVENKTFYDRVLLKRLLPNLVWAKFAQKKPLPRREGDTINFRRFNSLAPATTPLQEGITPAGNTLSISTVEATVKQYGDYITYSDKLDLIGIDPVITETAELLGEQAGLTIDTIVRDIVVNGTSVQYAGDKANADEITAEDKLTGAEVKKAVRELRKRNVKPFEGGYYILILDPDGADDLMNDEDWKDVSKYNGGEKIMAGEVGKIWGAKVITTTQVKTYTNANEVTIHCGMLLGSDAYGVVDIEGSGRKPGLIVKPLGSAGTADPLDQRGSIGWKALFTAVRLNELAMTRIEYAATGTN